MTSLGNNFGTAATTINHSDMLTIIHSEPGYDHLNEDAVRICGYPNDPQALVCALADGQGGQFGGAPTAQTAVDESLQSALSRPLKKLCRADTWYEIVDKADEAVLQNPEAGYTTLISLCITPRGVWGASCGDSALLLISGSETAWLTENQRKKPPVGSGSVLPVTFSKRLRSQWKLLLMSDGVWKYVGLDSIVEQVRNTDGDKLIHSLRQLALDTHGGKLRDDFSTILVQEQ